MRYAGDHKKKTHDRIVAEAGRLFREEGYKGSSVDAVMRAAELTPGGFYAHFRDKDALLAEVVGHSLFEKSRVLEPAPGAAPPPDAFPQWVDAYLSQEHLKTPGKGCLLPSLAGEIARQPKKVRAAFTKAIQARLDGLARVAPGETEAQRDERAIITLASLAGAVMLARALDDPELSERILRVVRDAALAPVAESQRKFKSKRSQNNPCATGSTSAKRH